MPDTATVVISAKSTSDAYKSTLPFPPDPNSPQSTISTVEREIKEAGGEATAIPADVRNHSSVQHLIKQTVNVSEKSMSLSTLEYLSRYEGYPLLTSRTRILISTLHTSGLTARISERLTQFSRSTTI